MELDTQVAIAAPAQGRRWRGLRPLDKRLVAAGLGVSIVSAVSVRAETRAGSLVAA